LDKVVANLTSKLGWLNDMIAKQNDAAKHAPLIVTSDKIRTELAVRIYLILGS
jgi:hypothetical protein